MIDDRSAAHLDHPFDHVDGARVRLLHGPHKGREGTIAHQLGYEPRGVRVVVVLDDGAEHECVAGDCLFLNPREHASLRAHLFAPPVTRYVPMATAWGVWDQVGKRFVEPADGYAAADRRARELNE